MFQPGVNRGAFTAPFNPTAEPLLIWEIDGESIPASIKLPNVPLCTPLADIAFGSGFEAKA